MGHDSLPRLGPPFGVKPYSCFVVDWPRPAEDELVQWENNLRKRSVLVLDELVAVREIRMIRPLLRWWCCSI